MYFFHKLCPKIFGNFLNSFFRSFLVESRPQKGNERHNKFIFLIRDSSKIYSDSWNLWKTIQLVEMPSVDDSLGGTFEQKTCVGILPSILREARGKTIPEIAVPLPLRFHCYGYCYVFGDPSSENEVPFCFEPPLSHESSRIFCQRDGDRRATVLRPLPSRFDFTLFLSVFLEFPHLISRVHEDRVYPLYALRVSSSSSPSFVPSFSFFLEHLR